MNMLEESIYTNYSKKNTVLIHEIMRFLLEYVFFVIKKKLSFNKLVIITSTNRNVSSKLLEWGLNSYLSGHRSGPSAAICPLIICQLLLIRFQISTLFLQKRHLKKKVVFFCTNCTKNWAVYVFLSTRLWLWRVQLANKTTLTCSNKLKQT